MYGSQSNGSQSYSRHDHYRPNHAPHPVHHAGHGYQGGYRDHHQHHHPPSGADAQLWQWFCAVDSDRSGSISVTELQTALINGNWTSFDLDTVKMLMGIFDTDRSGSINYTEFAGLWKYISDWSGLDFVYSSPMENSSRVWSVRRAPCPGTAQH
ncbi:putative EF-hand domain pair [Lyophyllum shimeji]|uniref:EF-hand domain pair n=1 Tax=Lyophyllum shimeji TaxID=47721 RepID=A0A9P3PFQ3_LYOSH|nr:putative EF-hand domain pair [Lyophyllum shimeji]